MKVREIRWYPGLLDTLQNVFHVAIDVLPELQSPLHR